MSEDKPEYQSEIEEAMAMLGVGYDKNQPSMIIEKPSTGFRLEDNVLVEYKVWGWVKISANFIHHIRRLKGAKLSIWQVIALSINDDGVCKFSLKDLVVLTGYSRSEVIVSLQELDQMGYLSTQKEAGKSSIYSPEFAARGENSPSNIPVQKLDGSDTRPVLPYHPPSSPPIEKPTPSIKELKRVSSDSPEKDKVLEWLQMGQFPGAKKELRVDAILSYLGETLHRTTTSKEWENFAKWVDNKQQKEKQSVETFVKWMVSQKNYDPQYWPIKKMMEFWPMAFVKENTAESKPYQEPEGNYVPRPAHLVPNIKGASHANN